MGEQRITEQESQVLQLRLALADDTWHSLEEVARRVQLPPAKTRVLQAQTLRRLRSHDQFVGALRQYVRLAAPPRSLLRTIAWLVRPDGEAEFPR